MCACGRVQGMHVWKSEDSLWSWSFHLMWIPGVNSVVRFVYRAPSPGWLCALKLPAVIK